MFILGLLLFGGACLAMGALVMAWAQSRREQHRLDDELVFGVPQVDGEWRDLNGVWHPYDGQPHQYWRASQE